MTMSISPAAKRGAYRLLARIFRAADEARHAHARGQHRQRWQCHHVWQVVGGDRLLYGVKVRGHARVCLLASDASAAGM